jgi:hypothetical protein
MAMTPEGKVKNTIRDELKRIGAFFFFPATGGYGASGIPDVVGCHRGVLFGLEAKAGKGKPTKLQELQIRKINEAGGIALVVDETNAPSIGAWLEETIEMVLTGGVRHDT